MGRRGSRHVIVYSSKDWTLAWPRDQWEALAPEEQQDVLKRQKSLCERMRGRGRRSSGAVSHAARELVPNV